MLRLEFRRSPVMRATSAMIITAALVLGLSSTTAAQSQSNAQRACIGAMNKAAGKVAAAQTKASRKCLGRCIDVSRIRWPRCSLWLRG